MQQPSKHVYDTHALGPDIRQAWFQNRFFFLIKIGDLEIQVLKLKWPFCCENKDYYSRSESKKALSLSTYLQLLAPFLQIFQMVPQINNILIAFKST